MKHITYIFLLMAITMSAQGQEKSLPYDSIPNYTEYNEGTVLARFIDGLGFRYRWASENLTEKDLMYRPTPESRSSEETIRHIYDLSVRINNAAMHTITISDDKKPVFTIEVVRKMTLENLKQAAEIFSKTDDLSSFLMLSDKGERPLWNLMNGPINDATWHCGQLASFRRITNNPINPKVNHFYGKINK